MPGCRRTKTFSAMAHDMHPAAAPPPRSVPGLHVVHPILGRSWDIVCQLPRDSKVLILRIHHGSSSRNADETAMGRAVQDVDRSHGQSARRLHALNKRSLDQTTMTVHLT